MAELHSFFIEHLNSFQQPLNDFQQNRLSFFRDLFLFWPLMNYTRIIEGSLSSILLESNQTAHHILPYTVSLLQLWQQEQ